MPWIDDQPDQTIGEALSTAVELYGDREGFTFPERRLGLREVDRRSDAAAKGFLARGIGRGDRVGVWMASHAEWPMIYFALLKIGAVIVPLNTRSSPSELGFVLSNSGVRGLVFKQERTESGKDYGSLLKGVIPELAAADVQAFTSQTFPRLGFVLDLAARPMPGCLGLEAFLEDGAAIDDRTLAAARASVRPRDEALIQYTSGTTAKPKGARLYHAGMLRGGALTFDWLQLTERDTYFSVQPFYHSGGTIASMLAPVLTGCRLVTLTYFNTEAALLAMERERATVMVGHQPHFIEYMNHPRFKEMRLCIERMLVIAPGELFGMVQQAFGVSALVSGYGMTETHMFGTATSLAHDPEEVRFNTNGRPNAGVTLEIRDPETGERLPDGESGEIHMLTPYPMLGYLDEPELTAEVLGQDGWYRTGDRGVIDENGNLKLLGRVREMIRVGGENLGAAEVEACLLEHPCVKQAAVVAAPDPRLGEIAVAFVELKPDTAVSADEIIDHCKAALASFKVPRKVHFVTEWPMSGSGKIQKRLLQPA